jgi:orotate phosphoribosyltransferase
MREYFAVKGVVKRSFHLYRRGLGGPYYADFDIIINDPERCEQVVAEFSNRIASVARRRKVDWLAFIEKSAGGTVGAVRLSGALSIATKVPNMIIRMTKELKTERLKVGAPPFKLHRLNGENTVLITDHCTTGAEILEAADTVRYNGGNVSDALAYSYRPDTINLAGLEQAGIVFQGFFEIPQDFPGSLKTQLSQEILEWIRKEVPSRPSILSSINLLENLALFDLKRDDLHYLGKELDASLDAWSTDKTGSKLDEESRRFLRNEIVMAVLFSAVNS